MIWFNFILFCTVFNVLGGSHSRTWTNNNKNSHFIESLFLVWSRVLIPECIWVSDHLLIFPLSILPPWSSYSLNENGYVYNLKLSPDWSVSFGTRRVQVGSTFEAGLGDRRSSACCLHNNIYLLWDNF